MDEIVFASFMRMVNDDLIGICNSLNKLTSFQIGQKCLSLILSTIEIAKLQKFEIFIYLILVSFNFHISLTKC